MQARTKALISHSLAIGFLVGVVTSVLPAYAQYNSANIPVEVTTPGLPGQSVSWDLGPFSPSGPFSQPPLPGNQGGFDPPSAEPSPPLNDSGIGGIPGSGSMPGGNMLPGPTSGGSPEFRPPHMRRHGGGGIGGNGGGGMPGGNMLPDPTSGGPPEFLPPHMRRHGGGGVDGSGGGMSGGNMGGNGGFPGGGTPGGNMGGNGGGMPGGGMFGGNMGGSSGGASGGNAGNPPRVRNGLPPTSLDSFVLNAKEHAEHIYGDEGAEGLPPYMGFGKVHRINTGIMDMRDQGLTTGHGSMMPDAVGRDEFLGQEWSLSGANGGQQQRDAQADGVDTMGGSQDGGGVPTPPYEIGPGWAPVTNTHNGQIMGWMAPGETYQEFFSGQSGHLLPGWEAEGEYILNNQLGGLGSSPWQ